MKMIIKEVQISKDEHCLVLKYPDERSCADAFFRIDELDLYFKEFRRRNISREEIFERYCKRTGQADYKTQWAGYCLDGKGIYRVTDNCTDLSEKERELKIICFDYDVGLDTIIVACAQKDPITYKHELAHAFYGNNLLYNTEVCRILENIDMVEFNKDLVNMGYTNLKINDIRDEFHAYCVAGAANSNFSVETMQQIDIYKKRLRAIFTKAMKGFYNYE